MGIFPFGLLKIISDYAYALDILDRYDYQKLNIEETSGKETDQLTYKEAISQISRVKKVYGNSDFFGNLIFYFLVFFFTDDVIFSSYIFL